MDQLIETPKGKSSEIHKFNHQGDEQMNEQHLDATLEKPIVEVGKPLFDGPEPKTTSWPSSEHPPEPATIAALEFEVASLLDDGRSSITWNGRECVVNTPGDFSRKYDALRRIANAHFPSRGDILDVLDRTIDEYGLWKWANPLGFWQAFKHDMLDAAKTAFEAKRICLEKAGRTRSDRIRPKRNSFEWTGSGEALAIDGQTAQGWLLERSGELHASESSILNKWEIAQASDYELDRLVCEALRRVAADSDYMEELADSKRETAKLTRLVAEVRSVARCSQAEAYRLLGNFKKRHSRAGGK